MSAMGGKRTLRSAPSSRESADGLREFSGRHVGDPVAAWQLDVSRSGHRSSKGGVDPAVERGGSRTAYVKNGTAQPFQVFGSATIIDHSTKARQGGPVPGRGGPQRQLLRPLQLVTSRAAEHYADEGGKFRIARQPAREPLRGASETDLVGGSEFRVRKNPPCRRLNQRKRSD